MKKWGLRILSAFLTFTLGLCAAAIVRFRLAPVAKVETVVVGAEPQAQLPSPQIGEDTQLTEKGYVPIQPHLVSISPYEIKRILDKNELSPCQHGEYSGFFDFEPIWERLKLIISNDSAAFPERCTSPAKANIYTLELDGKPGKEILLRLDFGEPFASLYLIFKHESNQKNTEWKLLGSLPYYYGAPFVAPLHRVVTAGKQRWLAIEYIGGHGSGYGLNFEDWYQISESGVSQVLTYQTGLFVCCSNPGIDSRTRVVKVDSKGGVATVLLQFSNSFDIYPDGRLSLWTTKRKVTYIKRPDSREFVIDPLNSEMSDEELDALSRFDNDDDYLKGILKYNYRELASIAAGRDTKRKEWLRDFIAARNDSPEKQSLQKALAGAQP